MNPRTIAILTFIGFLLFFFGMMSLILSLMGLSISFLDWMSESFGRGGAFFIHLCMIVIGLVLTAAVRSNNFAGEDPVRKEPLDTSL